MGESSLSVGNTPSPNSAGSAPKPDSKTLGETSHDAPAANSDKPRTDLSYGGADTKKAMRMPMSEPDSAVCDELAEFERKQQAPKSPITRA